MRNFKFLLAAFALFAIIISCNSENGSYHGTDQPSSTDQSAPKVTPVDTLKILPDVELVNHEMDARVASMKRKTKPVPPPPPPDVPPTQPTPEFCIFIDHDGHTTSGTMWNVSGPIVSEPSGLSLVQQAEILESVRNDYKPITGVYVTNDSTIFLRYAPTKRMRVVVSASYQWYGSNNGGVAYINSAHWGDGSPCFVFSSLLGNNPKWNADAIAHESGHTLGLRHQSTWIDGVKTSEYNWGPDTGPLVGWAPIMGGSYYKLPAWWIGLNSIGVMQNDTTVLNASVRQ